jgi:hypothetical protein
VTPATRAERSRPLVFGPAFRMRMEALRRRAFELPPPSREVLEWEVNVLRTEKEDRP